MDDSTTMIKAMTRTHNKVINNRHSNLSDQKLKQYEIFLKDLYFPSQGINSYQRSVNFLKGIKKIIQEKYGTTMQDSETSKNMSESFRTVMDLWIANYDKSITDIITQNKDKEWRLIGDKYEHFQHKDYILKSTLEKRMQLIESILENVYNNQDIDYSIIKDLETLIPNLKTQLDNYITIFNEFLALYGPNTKLSSLQDKINLKGDGNEKLLEKISLLDKCYSNFVMEAPKISAILFGDVLEWSLDYATQMFLGTAIATEEDEILQGLVKSSKGTNGGKVGDQPVGLYSNNYKEISERVQKKMASYKSFILKGGKGEGVKVDTKYDYDKKSRQQKMDVHISVPIEEESQPSDLRISAKNWSNEKDRDFGEAPLLNILLRTFEDDKPVDSYIKNLKRKRTNLLNENNDDKKNVEGEVLLAHKMARWAIFLDTVVGYSQQTGYANLLVLVVRNNISRPVQVHSIPQLAEKVWKGINNNTINDKDYLNYHSRAIRQQLMNLYNSGSSEAGLAASYYYLSTIKTSMRYRNIKNSIWSS